MHTRSFKTQGLGVKGLRVSRVYGSAGITGAGLKIMGSAVQTHEGSGVLRRA